MADDIDEDAFEDEELQRFAENFLPSDGNESGGDDGMFVAAASPPHLGSDIDLFMDLPRSGDEEMPFVAAAVPPHIDAGLGDGHADVAVVQYLGHPSMQDRTSSKKSSRR